MIKQIEVSIHPSQIGSEDYIKHALAKALGIKPTAVNHTRILKRSIDARSKHVVYRVLGEIYTEKDNFVDDTLHFDYKNVSSAPSAIVVGAGPAGLFAALKLIERGIKPIVLERGKNISERKYDIAKLTREHIVNPDSNYCFGEGGAGTFSDGKLYTRSNKRGNIKEILQILINHGADASIMIDAHPHIGTDKLPQIIAHIRQTITDCGGEYYFDTRVTDFIIKNNIIQGVVTQDGTKYEACGVILATGHSARDVYDIFIKNHLQLESKGFAMGVRAEHPQDLINQIQYHKSEHINILPPAAYSLITQVEGQGVFSFCMCPGGIIVPASTQNGELVINGMSNSRRNSPWANAGIVVSVDAAEIPEYKSYGVLANLQFQRDVEQQMYTATQSQASPAQRMTDFVKGKISSSLPESSYKPGVASLPLHELLPAMVTKRLQQAFLDFDKKMKGYYTSEALLLGVESRTSSPIRIPRDKESLEYVQIANLYPCGEGAGYAGGIVSSAMDGINCAERLAQKLGMD